MNRTIAITLISTLAIIVFGAYLFSRQSDPKDQTTNSASIPQQEAGVYEYYWGLGCPHCEIVAKFMESWDKKDKINIKKFEVWNNKENASVMLDRAEKCNIKKNELGVPFMVDPSGKCFYGDQPIIDLLKSL
jgi:hypothetical protein